MKKYFITLIIFLSFYGISSALNPVKVAIVNPGATNVQINAEIIDLEGPTTIYVAADQGTYNADDNGLISFRVGVSDANWDGVGAAGIDGSWVLNIYTDGTLYAQYRLDKILFDQAGGLLNMDDDGNLVPSEDNTQSLGTNDLRWSDIFIGPSTVHIGNDLTDEATIGFDAINNGMEFSINGTQEFVVTPTTTTFNGNVDATSGLDVTGADLTAGSTNINPSTGDVSVGGTLSSAGDFDVNSNFNVNAATGNTNISGTTTSSGLIIANAGLDITGGTFGLPAGTTVNEITSIIDGSSTNNQLSTAAAINSAISGFDLQSAYAGGSTITSDLTNGNVVIEGTEDFDVQTPLINSSTNIVLIQDNFRVNGTSDLRGTISNNGGGTAVTVDDIDGFAVINGVISATAGLDVTGANLDVGGGSFTVTPTGIVSGASASYTGTVDAVTLTEGGNAVPNATESPNIAGNISGNYAAGLTIDTDAVGTTELADASVTTAKLADVSVTTAKLADNSVTSAKITDGTIATADLADDAVTSVKILTDAVGLDALDQAANYSFTGAVAFSNIDVAGGEIDGTPIGVNTAAAGNFTSIIGTSTATLGDDAVGTQGQIILQDDGIASGLTGTLQTATLSVSSKTYTFPDATGNILLDVSTPNATGDISGDYATGLTIGTDAVGTTELADASVTTAKIVDVNVTTAKLADVSVTTAKLADNSVTSAKITDGTIAAVDIGTGAVTSTEILDGTIATVDLADDAVTSVKILTDAVGLDALDQAANYNFSGTITIATADINGGNIDGTEIGATTQAAGSFTTLTATSTSDLQGTISNSSLNNSGAVHVGDEFSATNTTTSSTVTLNNSNGGANTHAIVVTNGHTQYSSDASTTLIATSGNITVSNNTVIRFNTGTAAASSITIDAGANIGQVIYITNEDIGDLTFDGTSVNILKAYVVPAEEARPFVWNGGNWVMM